MKKQGTEKQVKWAEDIREEMIARVEEKREMYRSRAAKRNMEIREIDNAICDDVIAIINKVSYASTFISYRKALGNMMQDKFPEATKKMIEEYNLDKFFRIQFYKF